MHQRTNSTIRQGYFGNRRAFISVFWGGEGAVLRIPTNWYLWGYRRKCVCHLCSKELLTFLSTSDIVVLCFPISQTLLYTYTYFYYIQFNTCLRYVKQLILLLLLLLLLDSAEILYRGVAIYNLWIQASAAPIPQILSIIRQSDDV